MSFPIGKTIFGIRMQFYVPCESYVYLFNAKDFNKPIDKIPFSLGLNILRFIHLGHSMFSGNNYYVLEDINDWAMKPRVLMVEIYGKSIKDLTVNPAVINLENNGYKFVERTGHTAIFVLS